MNLRDDSMTSLLQQSGLVHDICHDLLSIGITLFTYIEVHASGQFLILSSDKQIFSRVIVSQEIYLLIDALIHQNISRGFHLSLSQSAYAQHLLNSSLKPLIADYKLGNFLLKVDSGHVHQQPILQFYLFASESSNTSINDLYFNQQSMINQFTSYFYSRMQPYLSRLAAIPHPRQDTLSRKIIAILKQFSSAEPLCQNSDPKFSTSTPAPIHRELNITEKQEIILIHTIQGLTAKQIAKLVFLSPKTIEKYYYQWSKRLNCKSKIELIARLYQLGIVQQILKKHANEESIRAQSK